MTQDEEMKKLEEIDKKYPHIKILVNLFYEMTVIQAFMLPMIESGLKKYNKMFSFSDKKNFKEIQRLFDAIIKRNDEMIEPFFSLPRDTFKELQKNANDMTRMILLLLDRCGYDKSRWNFLENYVQQMPSSGFIKDDILENFHLR